MDTNTLYTEIGRMAYAVAKSNGDVKEKEVENIFNFIDKEMEQTGSGDVLYVGTEFTKLRKMNVSARDAFHMFNTFIEHHGSAIQQNIKNMCIRLALVIAETDEGADETEIALINKLKKKLQAT